MTAIPNKVVTVVNRFREIQSNKASYLTSNITVIITCGSIFSGVFPEGWGVWNVFVDHFEAANALCV